MGTTARLDRLLLTLFALLLIVIGVLGLLVGLGGFGPQLRSRPVFDNVIGRFVGVNGTWLWPAIALTGLLLGYLALRWLIAQLHPTRVRRIELEPSALGGHTDLLSAAVTEAITDEINSYRGVFGSSARLTGDARQPHLQLRVELDARADVAALRQRIEVDAVTHARHALDQPQLPVRLDLIVTSKKAARVR